MEYIINLFLDIGNGINVAYYRYLEGFLAAMSNYYKHVAKVRI